VQVLADAPTPESAIYDVRSGTAGAVNPRTMETFKQHQFDAEKEKELKESQETRQKVEEEQEAKPALPLSVEQRAKIDEYETKGVYIEKVTFTPSEILSEKELEKFKQQLIYKNLKIEDIQKVLSKINDLYAEKGFVTARAFLPIQKITEGELNVRLVEGKVGSIEIEGNKWTKDGYILHRMNEKTGDLFEIPLLEADIVKFNRYNENVQLKASIQAGEKPETTDVVLTAEEKNPFHTAFIWDNAGRQTIGQQRAGFMFIDDSLTGHRDQLTVGTYLSSGSVTPFVDYNFPVNKHDGRIGFSFSSSNTRIIDGDYKDFNISSRAYIYSAYYNQPLIRKPFFELGSLTALNYKQATNTFDGYDLSTDKIASAQGGFYARYDTKKGIWYATQTAYKAFPLFCENSDYFIYSGSVTRLHDFGHNIVGQFRFAYQWSPNDIVSYVDQFQAGGIASTRGYSEGLLIGKSGYLLSAEVLFPIAPETIKRKGKEVPFLGKYVKGVLFVDQAAVFPYKGEGAGAEGFNADDLIVGAGPGLRIALPGDVTLRLYLGFPVGRRNAHEYDYHSARIHFELTAMPDFDKLLKHRKKHETI
jgi:hemolysin activation/secretion protein